MSHTTEVAEARRFEFGKNWSDFLRRLTPERIERAKSSLREMLGRERLDGLDFLDIGCGSGVFSLAAHELGARVHSFDYDPYSVGCAAQLRTRAGASEDAWRVEEGSALDAEYVRSLGEFDIVYSWGVLHHTGEMWRALENAALAVKPGGLLFIAIYNDCGNESVAWVRRKKRYNELPRWLRPLYAVAAIAPYEVRAAAGSVVRGRPHEYVRTWTRYQANRGMSRWHDILDWVGGYPYEYASTDALVDFYRKLGFEPVRLKPTKGLGCNELVLRRMETT